MPTAGPDFVKCSKNHQKGDFVQLLGLLGAFLSVKHHSSVNPLAFLRVCVCVGRGCHYPHFTDENTKAPRRLASRQKISESITGTSRTRALATLTPEMEGQNHFA